MLPSVEASGSPQAKKRGKVGRRSEGDLVQAYAEVQVRDVKVIAQCLKNDRLTPHDWMIKVS